MRRFLTTSFIILALAVSAAGATPAAHAGTGQEGYACHTSADCDESHALTCDANLQCTKPNVDSPTLTQEQKAAAAKTAADVAASRTESSNWGFDFIMTKVMGLFSWLVGVAAVSLDYAMYYTVVGMGTYVKELSAIGLVWKILRDIGNIMLIFGFLAIGISIILDSDWYGGGKKLLPILLIAAIFTNFSLFAAEAVIDIGNLFATQIYKQINGNAIPTQPSSSTIAAVGNFVQDVRTEPISTVLMTKLNLTTLYGNARDPKKEVLKPGSPWYIGFLAIILFIVIAFVMFTLAFILLSRFVVLIILIMVSPIGVAGMAVPGLKTWADKWWHTLFQQTITAPILLLLLYIALRVITDDNFLRLTGGAKPDWTGTLNGADNIPGFGGIMLSFFVAMGLLLAVVYFAKTLSAVGAGGATKLAGKLSFGATAFVGRRSVGRLSNYSARKIRSSSLGRSETGRLLAGFADRGAKASFDVRGTSALKNIPGGGIGAGEAQKGGYKGTEDNAIKARVDYANSLKERGQTRSETQQLETIKTTKDYMGKLHETAEAEHKPIEAETIELRAEVKHLENLVIKSPETDRALEVAKQKLVTSEKNLDTASTKLAEAAGNLKTWKNKETVATAEVKVATSADSARLAYGKSLEKKTFMGIPRKPYDYTTVAGSARREAAKKIKTEKPDKDKLADLLKKMQKADEAEGKKEEKTEEEPKPEAPKP